MAYIFKADHEHSYLPGIPARGLSDDEFKALTAEQQAAVKSSKLYEVATPAVVSIAADVPATPEHE